MIWSAVGPAVLAGGAPLRAAPSASVDSMSRATIRPWGPDPVTRARSMPASPASRRASGVTTPPPASLAGPKFRAGVRTSKNGSSLMGPADATDAVTAADAGALATRTGVADFGAGTTAD